ncbi:COX15/CtaA family protein [soil metagenome]
MRTPFAWLAGRLSLGPRALRWGTTAALLVSILIIFTGGVVRVTGSGLGCPTWPTCDGESISAPVSLGIHGAIEFGNRALTGVLIVAVGWAIVAARLQKPRNRAITRLAWSQFWLVVVNALAGGLSVLAQLNPWVVAVHFLLAIGLLATTTLTWHRVRDQPMVGRPPGRASVALAWALLACTAVLVIVGTLVTGSGPHSGDSAEVPRMGFVWEQVTVLHAVLGTATLVIALALWFSLRGAGRPALARRRVLVFLVLTVLQGAVGTIQALSGLPELLVALHLLGAALVWIGAIRVLLDVQPQLFSGVQPIARDDVAVDVAASPIGSQAL